MTKYHITFDKTSPSDLKLVRLINSIPYNIDSKHFKQAANIARKGKEICDGLRKKAIERGDESSANSRLVLKAYFELLEHLSLFWEELKQREYQNAWDNLQDAISASKFCLQLMDNPTELSVPELKTYLLSYEKLFPYKIFASIGVVITKSHCTICGRDPLDLNCVHIPGELYMGEIAQTVIDDIEFNEVSLVEHPKDKRCVVHIEYDRKHPEKSSFESLYRISTLIEKPLRFLDIQMEAVEKNTNDLHCMDSFDCPCGSGLLFGECCSGKPTIIVPRIKHVQITNRKVIINVG